MQKVYFGCGCRIVPGLWNPNVDIIQHTKLHLGLVLSMPMSFHALRQVSVVSLIKIFMTAPLFNQGEGGGRVGGSCSFYGKNNKSLKLAIPGNYGHEPTLMTPSSANITTEVDLLIIRADGLLLVKEPFRHGSLVCIRWLFSFFFFYSQWSVENQDPDVLAENNCSPPNTAEGYYTIELPCALTGHGQGN